MFTAFLAVAHSTPLDSNGLYNTLYSIIGILTIGGALFGLWRTIMWFRDVRTTLTGRKGGRGVRAVPSLVELVDAHSDKLEQLGKNSEMVLARLHQIDKKITVNGGSSNDVGDRLERIESSTARTATAMDSFQQRLSEVERYMKRRQ